MKGQELKILFKKDKAYLTSNKPMTLDQVSLPDFAQRKGFKSPAYWIVRVLNHKENEKRLFCEVVSYNTGETEFGYNQKKISEKLEGIDFVTFRNIDTSGLLQTMTGTTSVKATTKILPKYRPIVREPIKNNVTETFYVPLKRVRFILGGVLFDKKIKGHNKAIEVKIQNYDIREEFDAVKNYFANALKTKKIQVTIDIEITDEEITSIVAKSPEIDRINKELIDNVKFEFVKSTTKKKLNIEIDKSLFTMDEYFDTFADEKFKSNTFYNNEKELFEDLLTISNTKHYKHLRFLSSKHAHDIMKLRFVHKPFSFIFLIQGDRNYHIVWETLDTEEATYVWHIAKDISILKSTLRKIEDIINIIKVQGKTAYISSSEDAYKRIYHDYSEIIDGFAKWKGELESILT